MIAIDKLTTEQLERFIHIQSIIDRQEDEARRVVAYRAYYDGEHPILLTDRQREYIGDLLATENFTFAHNVSRTVVDKLRERLEVVGFIVNGESADESGEGGPDGALAAQLWDWWKSNRMIAEQIRAYRYAIRDGKSYAMVSFDNETRRPDIVVFPVWDGTSGVTFHRDPENPKKVLFANRYFYTFDPLSPGETGRLRKTTYLAHEIRKYKQGGNANGWEPLFDPEDATWPLPWLGWDGKPLGVALVEFANPGGSELTQILGLQNGLNHTWLGLLAAVDASGFPILAVDYPEGAPIENDSDADLTGADELVIGPGRLLEFFNGATSHRIEGADLTSMIDVIWALVAAISSVSGTPQYHLRPLGGSDVPSGEALKMLESALTKRAEERQLFFGQGWGDVMALCHRVARTYGKVTAEPSDYPLNINCQWADAEVRNDAVEIAVAEGLKRLNVPDEIVWSRAGLTPEQIAGARTTARNERMAEVAAMASALQLQAVRTAPQTNPATGGA